MSRGGEGREDSVYLSEITHSAGVRRVLTHLLVVPILSQNPMCLVHGRDCKVCDEAVDRDDNLVQPRVEVRVIMLVVLVYGSS